MNKRTFFVTRPAGIKPMVITADYLKIENGHLYFRDHVDGDYPELVTAIAPGHWATVEPQV